ncbi:MAG: sterol desaturase family protein [Sulfuricaulis sp.]|nr:sterol desaturase family protein [Sulfuricaulis sp.]MCR4346538.1 sterol desaturase family protein [Sulfuricaulis sp.]
MTITEFIQSHEPAMRLGFFFGILATMALWEILAPRRKLSLPKAARWANNLAIVFLNSFLLRFIFPLGAVGVALLAYENEWGVLNQFYIPDAAALVVSVMVLDLAIYLQHVMFHAIPVLWRLHRVHHADLDFDVATGARFHPIEIILSMVIKFAVILVLGPPVLAVIIFEILLSTASMFNHSNVRMPRSLDRLLRSMIVTPDMHRVHHSILDHETNSNFGFNLSWWDRLLDTYRDQPEHGHQKMTIGIREFRQPRQTERLWGMLTIPFAGKVTGYAINRRWNSSK